MQKWLEKKNVSIFLYSGEKKNHGPESLREVKKKKREREYDSMKKTSNQTNRDF